MSSPKVQHLQHRKNFPGSDQNNDEWKNLIKYQHEVNLKIDEMEKEERNRNRHDLKFHF